MAATQVALDLVEVGGHVLARRALVLVGQLGDALGRGRRARWTATRAARCRGPSGQCAGARNGFRAASEAARILRRCCSDSTSAGWTGDLRGRLPRPAGAGRAAHRRGPGAARRRAGARRRRAARAHRALRRRRGRRPAGPADRRGQGAWRRSRPTCGPPSRSPTPTSPPTTRRSATPTPSTATGASRCASCSGPVDRAACYVPSALAPLVSTVLMTAVPAKVAGVPEVVLVTSPQRDGTVAPGDPRGGRHRRRRRGVPGRRPGRDRRPRLRHRVDPARRRHRRPRQRPGRPGQARGRVGRAWSACRAPSPGPSEVVVIADASHAGRVGRHRRRAPGRARARTAWRGSSPGTRRSPTASPTPSPRSCRGRRGAQHLEATLAEGGYAVLCDGPEQAIEIANAIAPEHLELLVDDPDALAAARPPRRRGVLRAVRAGVGRRLPRRAQPRAAHLRLGPLLRRAAGRRLPQARPRRVGRPGRASPRSASTSIALATYEGLDAHAESIRLRQGPS